ncbi:MAG: hypothetical protein AB7Q76_22360 [Gammaproteobacteria bacterium]
MTTVNAASETLLNPESLAPVFDKLVEQQAELGQALKESQARTQRIGTELVDNYLATQRDLLELTRKMALQPQDYASNIKAMVDASAVAQERAISLAKLFYKEQADVFGGVRKWVQSSCESTGNMTQAGRNWMNLWSRQA